MSTDQTWELRCHALGRILDRRAELAKEICIMQVEDGFVVSLLAPTGAVAGPAYMPATITIEASEIQAVMAELMQPPPAAVKGDTGGLRWFNRR